MGYGDPQCKHTTVNHMQPVLFREAQEAFKFTETHEEIAKQAIAEYTRNLMSMYTSLLAARKEQSSGPEARQEVQPEVRG